MKSLTKKSPLFLYASIMKHFWSFLIPSKCLFQFKKKNKKCCKDSTFVNILP